MIPASSYFSPYYFTPFYFGGGFSGDAPGYLPTFERWLAASQVIASIPGGVIADESPASRPEGAFGVYEDTVVSYLTATKGKNVEIHQTTVWLSAGSKDEARKLAVRFREEFNHANVRLAVPQSGVLGVVPGPMTVEESTDTDPTTGRRLFTAEIEFTVWVAAD